MPTKMTSYDLKKPFRIEEFGFVLDSVEERPNFGIATFYKRGDLEVMMLNGIMIVISRLFFGQPQIGNGIVYAGECPTCHHHGKILFEMMPAYNEYKGVEG